MSRKHPSIVERKLGRERAAGQYIEGDALIEIDPRLPPKDRLEIVAHEALHHALPSSVEREVARIARCVSGALWRDGWRRIYK
jgi:hypothetical protein